MVTYRILVIEKSYALRKYLEHSLKSIAEVISIPHGELSIQILNESKIDLVIYDLESDSLGPTLCSQLIAQTYSLPLIFMSSRSASEAIEMLIDCTYSALLLKPFHPKPLRTLVCQLLHVQSIKSLKIPLSLNIRYPEVAH